MTNVKSDDDSLIRNQMVKIIFSIPCRSLTMWMPILNSYWKTLTPINIPFTLFSTVSTLNFYYSKNMTDDFYLTTI